MMSLEVRGDAPETRDEEVTMKVTSKAIDVEPGDRVTLEVREVVPEDGKVRLVGAGGAVIEARTGKGRPVMLEVDRPSARSVSADGENGVAIQAVLRHAPKGGVAPQEVADKVGCSVSRVYEVLRATEATRVGPGRWTLREPQAA
jgi:hypothetical protein